MFKDDTANAPDGEKSDDLSITISLIIVIIAPLRIPVAPIVTVPPAPNS